MQDQTYEWVNPIVEQRADPWLYKVGDDYYFIATVPEYDRIELRTAKSVGALAEAEGMVIWTQHEEGPMKYHIWAPELHLIDGKWYIYFAAGHSEDSWKIRIYVLECSEISPMTTKWIERDQVKTAWDSFSLDSTTFEVDGKRYLVWAQMGLGEVCNSNLYIDEMVNPWTLAGRQMLLTKPELPWECNGFKVNEGPAVVFCHDQLFLTYSASKTDSSYCMGMMILKKGHDPLQIDSWVKSQEPVFTSDESAGQYGPGHNSFVGTEDPNRFIMVYHARNYKEIDGDPLHDPNRHARAQIVEVVDGKLILGSPVPDGIYSE